MPPGTIAKLTLAGDVIPYNEFLVSKVANGWIVRPNIGQDWPNDQVFVFPDVADVAAHMQALTTSGKAKEPRKTKP